MKAKKAKIDKVSYQSSNGNSNENVMIELQKLLNELKQEYPDLDYKVNKTDIAIRKNGKRVIDIYNRRTEYRIYINNNSAEYEIYKTRLIKYVDTRKNGEFEGYLNFGFYLGKQYTFNELKYLLTASLKKK